MKPAVSVVIPSFNHAAFVGQTIRSVLDQSFQDFEIVMTDDASTDQTVDVIRSFDDSRIKLEVFAHNRRGFTLSNCVRRATGEFVAVLNSDDFFLPGKLERQVTILRQRPDIAAVFGLPRLVDEAGQALGDGYREFTLPFQPETATRRDWLRHFFFHGNCLCHPTVLIRRAIYDEIGFYDPRYANLPDFDMWVRLCSRHEIQVLPEELTGFRILSGGRNVSAPGPQTLRRTMFEYAQVLRDFFQLSEELAREIFAADIAAHGIDASRPLPIWLGELALHGPHPAHRLFALQSIFDAAREDADVKRLHQLTGSVDALGIAPPDK